MTRNPNLWYWYHYDYIGNVAATTNQLGNQEDFFHFRYDQDSFGNVYGVSNPITGYIYGSKNGLAMSPQNQKGYHQTTKEYEDRANMYFFNFRWYDPIFGRFISQEPLGIDGPNLYHFNFNNPVNNYDPNGLFVLWNPTTWWDPNSVDDTFWDSINPLGSGGLTESLNESFISTNGTTARIGSGIWNWDWSEMAGNSLWCQMDEVDPCHQTYGRAAINGSLIISGLASIYSLGAILGILPNPYIGGIEIHAPHLGGPHQFPHLQAWLRWGAPIYIRVSDSVIKFLGEKFKLW
jgi:RHS repeat-associated protein